MCRHSSYAGQETAGARRAEEGFGNCGSQWQDPAAVLGAPREFEGITEPGTGPDAFMGNVAEISHAVGAFSYRS
jgi:hypothetical protein